VLLVRLTTVVTHVGHDVQINLNFPIPCDSSDVDIDNEATVVRKSQPQGYLKTRKLRLTLADSPI